MIIDFLWIDDVEEIPGFVRKFINETNTPENSELLQEQELLLTAYSLYLYTMAPIEEMNMMILSLLPDESIEETDRLFEGAAANISGEIAAKVYKKYKEINPDHAKVVALLTPRFHDDIRVAGVVAFYAPNDHEEAIDYYTVHLESSEHPLLYSERARHFGALDRDDEALADYERALALAPNEYKAWLHLERGYTYDKLERYEEEIIECTHALNIDSTYAGAFMQRSQTYSVLNKFDEAFLDAESALKCGSCSSYLYNWIAAISVESDCTPEKGLAYCEKAVKADPDESSNYYLRSGWKAELNDFDGALADINKALTMLPGDASYTELREKILKAKGE